MKVDAVLKTKGLEVKTIGPSATLATAAQQLRLERIGALVVLEHEKILGIISERDIVHAFAADRARGRCRSHGGHDSPGNLLQSQ